MAQHTFADSWVGAARISRPAKPRRPWLVFSELAIRDGRLALRKTGNSAPLDRALAQEILLWCGYHALVRGKWLRDRVRGRRVRRIWFAPDIPRPWYMVRAAALWAGIGIASSPAEADAAFYFDDSTWSPPCEPEVVRHLNFACTDISKSRVARLFEQSFGYALAIDPRTWAGDAVEKGEVNGAHDGRIVACPREPRPGKTYQRLIDTVEDGCAYDLRTHCIGGRPVIVWKKQRRASHRFDPPNLAATRHAPAEIFSDAEIAAIGRFTRAMGLDWGGLDILRDRADNRIYIVDVNKTDAGPIVALSLRDKLTSTAILADALTARIDAPT